MLSEGERAWWSATFIGARHNFVIELAANDAARRWLASLPEADFALNGHLVADLAVVDTSRVDDRLSATIEALTVEER